MAALKFAEVGCVSMTERVQQTFRMLAPYKVSGLASPSLQVSYSRRIPQSSFEIFADADCNNLMERLEQRPMNNSHQLSYLCNSFGLWTRYTCVGDPV